jgi:hypothetical protein
VRVDPLRVDLDQISARPRHQMWTANIRSRTEVLTQSRRVRT